MQQTPTFFQKVQSKLRAWQHEYINRPLKLGTPIDRQVWEQQFQEGMWDYLGSEDERGRFEEIVRCYREFGNGGTVLDVACGGGWLYGYLKEAGLIMPHQYLGVDLSQTAVDGAQKRFPEARFAQMDFDKDTLGERFDIIVFNECIYFFNKPAAKVDWCRKHNLEADGKFIFSIYGEEKNQYLWPEVAKGNVLLSEKTVTNNKGQQWTIKTLRPVA